MTSLNSRSGVSKAVRSQLERKELLKLQAILGSGTYARVRQAFSSRYGHPLAVKIIDRRRAKPDFVEHFLPRELAIVKRLRHPNIIRVMKVVDTEHIVCVLSELAEHGDLLNRVRNDMQIEEPTAKDMFRQMIEGIHYLHSMNVAHRDLKCENVLLDRWDNVKLADFGFARVMDSTSHTYCGSRAYAPPEILQAHAYGHCMGDIWSAGVILFIMVTGSMPFNEKDVHRMVRQQLSREITYPSRAHSLSSDAKQLIFEMLHPEAKERPDYDRLLVHPWLSGIHWQYRTDDVIYVLNKTE